MGHYDRYWPMLRGGPHEEGREIYKCTDCGAETEPAEGHNGEPESRLCGEECGSRNSDWRPGRVSNRYKDNFARTFPGSPGAAF